MTTPMQKLLTRYEGACDNCIEIMVAMAVWLDNVDAGTIAKAGYSQLSFAATECDAYGKRLHSALNVLYGIGVEFCSQIKLFSEEVNRIRKLGCVTDEGDERLAAITSDSRNIQGALIRIKNISAQGMQLLDKGMLPFLDQLYEETTHR